MSEFHSVSRDWPTSGGNAARSRVADALRYPLHLEWTFDRCRFVASGVVIAGNLAVFGDSYHVKPYGLYAVDVSTGRERWRVAVPGMLLGPPAISNGRVCFGNSSDVRCLDLDEGGELWRRVEPGRPEGGPMTLFASKGSVLCIGGFVLVGDGEDLVILDEEHGDEAGRLAASHDGWPHVRPSADDQFVYIPCRRGILRLSLRTGRVEEPIETQGKMCSGPVVAGRMLLYGTNRAALVAIDLDHEEILWSREFGSEESRKEASSWVVQSRPAVDGDHVFIGGPDVSVLLPGSCQRRSGLAAHARRVSKRAARLRRVGRRADDGRHVCGEWGGRRVVVVPHNRARARAGDVRPGEIRRPTPRRLGPTVWLSKCGLTGADALWHYRDDAAYA